jgi:hypothetical protein
LLHSILDAEVTFLLGAGASIPAQIGGVQSMVNKFLQKLQEEKRKSYFETTNRILSLLSEWRDQNQAVIDIELLLETVERLENRHLDVVPLFYNQKKNVKKIFKNLDLSKPKLSNIIKRFIKLETGKPDIQVDYLKELLKFMNVYRPLHIFSTNYDICIERFCEDYKKTWFDGFFDNEWKPSKFADIERDVLLYKMHGSVTWYRDEKGRYTRKEVHTEQSTLNIITGKIEIPFISYPGKKLEYFEPTIDLMVQLRNRLYDPNLKYIFVVGYSFRDAHIRRLFQYASETNDKLILFLIGPSAHEIYQTNLKHYRDSDFEDNASITERKSNVTSTSSLIDRVIRLPYKFEKVVDVLYDTYLQKLCKGIEQEKVENDKNENEIARWHECLLPYIECEYIDKVEEIIEQKIGWDELLMNSDYRLGCEIIVRSLLNVLPMESERKKWLDRLKKYIPISPQNLEVKVENDKVYALFRLIGQGLWHCDDALNFYNRLLDIYRKHPVFCNRVDLMSIENGEEIINKFVVIYQMYGKNH